MADTPLSLLERLRGGPAEADWRQVVALYDPLIRGWLGRYQVQAADLDDLTQDVFATLFRELPSFRHDLRRGAFRRWLKTMAVNRLRHFWRMSQRAKPADFTALDALDVPDSELSRAWDAEHDRHVVRQTLRLIETEFEPPTWLAFRRLVLEGRDTRTVAADLGLTPNAVRIAKSRVLARFREVATGFLD